MLTINHKNTTGSVVAGAVAIAGIEIAMALRNKKTREKVKKILINAKDQAINYVKTLEIKSNSEERTHATKKVVK